MKQVMIDREVLEAAADWIGCVYLSVAEQREAEKAVAQLRAALEAKTQEPLADAGGESTAQSPAVACHTLGSDERLRAALDYWKNKCELLQQRNLSLEVFAPEIDKAEDRDRRIAELEAELKYANTNTEVWKRDAEGKLEDRTEAYHKIAELESQLTADREARQAAEKDAERYRFLRQPNVGKWNVSQWMNEPAMFVRQDWTDLDYAVDAAIAQGKENGK